MSQPSTILIVDDQHSSRAALESILLGQGYTLHFAASGPEALAQAPLLLPDIILLDVMMPGMDGFEVCRRLRATPALAEVPIVILTALDDRESRLRGLEAGADDFLSKPVDRAELRARVRTITRLNRYRQLLDERQQASWIIEAAQDGYLLLDERGTIRYANPQAQRYLGLSEPGGSFLAAARQRYRCEPEEQWAQWPLLQRARPRYGACYLIRPESDTAKALWLQVDVLERQSSEAARWLLRLRDVTPQAQNQRELRKFHAIIHHKFRTPLAHVLGGLDVLMQEVDTLSPEETKEFAAVTVQGAQRLYGAIEDILAFIRAPLVARTGVGVSLTHLRELIEMICTRLELRPVRLSGVIGPTETYLPLSPEALEWILWEVLENARKFHPSGNPTLEAVVFYPSEQEIGLRIADDGLTLAPEKLADLWTPYYQGEKHFTGEVPGMGLGLATVASLIWESGGRCRLYNREDGPGLVVELCFTQSFQR